MDLSGSRCLCSHHLLFRRRSQCVVNICDDEMWVCWCEMKTWWCSVQKHMRVYLNLHYLYTWCLSSEECFYFISSERCSSSHVNTIITSLRFDVYWMMYKFTCSCVCVFCQGVTWTVSSRLCISPCFSRLCLLTRLVICRCVGNSTVNCCRVWRAFRPVVSLTGPQRRWDTCVCVK